MDQISPCVKEALSHHQIQSDNHEKRFKMLINFGKLKATFDNESHLPNPVIYVKR